MGSETKICQNCKRDFIIESEDFDFYEKIKVTAPTWCPECRLIRRLNWRGDRAFYKRKDDFSGREIFSMFSKSYQGKVYEHSVWWSDNWNPMDYGREYDFSMPFFEQFRRLLQETPLPARDIVPPVSDYSNYAGCLNNCYLVFNAGYCEGCAYGYRIANSKDSFDIAHCESCELCYECFKCQRCFRTIYSSNCEECVDVFFSKNCIGCSNCFGCNNLKSKKYYIFNKPYIQNDYFREMKNLNVGSFREALVMQEKMSVLSLNYPVRHMHGRKNNNVSGNYVFNSKNVIKSFDIEKSENLRYCHEIHYQPAAKDCYDYSSWGENATLVYECTNSGKGVAEIEFCFHIVANSRKLQYSAFCASSSNLFGCIGLRNKQYCILNKQYTKEEYEALVPKIIKHMNDMPYQDKKGRVYKYGEFFPPELSPFCYNETIAQEYFPLTKEQAIEQGYSWKDPEPRNYQIDIKNENLPDHIKDVKDDIVGKVIECEHKGHCSEQCTEAFRIIEPELQFYRRMNLPLPRLCPNCRHYQRLTQRNPLKLWQRQCQCQGSKSSNGVYQNTVSHQHGSSPCPNTFETSYSPERPEIVYCEKCYLQEVT